MITGDRIGPWMQSCGILVRQIFFSDHDNRWFHLRKSESRRMFQSLFEIFKALRAEPDRNNLCSVQSIHQCQTPMHHSKQHTVQSRIHNLWTLCWKIIWDGSSLRHFNTSDPFQDLTFYLYPHCRYIPDFETLYLPWCWRELRRICTLGLNRSRILP